MKNSPGLMSRSMPSTAVTPSNSLRSPTIEIDPPTCVQVHGSPSRHAAESRQRVGHSEEVTEYSVSGVSLCRWRSCASSSWRGGGPAGGTAPARPGSSRCRTPGPGSTIGSCSATWIESPSSSDAPGDREVLGVDLAELAGGDAVADDAGDGGAPALLELDPVLAPPAGAGRPAPTGRTTAPTRPGCRRRPPARRSAGPGSPAVRGRSSAVASISCAA